MANSPREPTNLVLEQLRLMRAETKELRGLKLNTIAEVYKANLTVASFADHERRIQALEQKHS